MPDARRSGDPQTDSQSGPRPVRLLLVEDQETDAELLELVLTRAGIAFTAERVDRRTELEAALASGSWDAVLCDYALPGLDALTVLELVRACDADTPFLVVSGAIDDETAVATMDRGAQDYVLKSNLARLPIALARELAAADQRRRLRHEQRAARESEQRYRNLFDGTSLSLFELDLTGVRRFVESVNLEPDETLEQHLQRPEALAASARGARVLGVNRTTERMFQLAGREDAIGTCERLIALGLAPLWRAIVLGIAHGDDRVEASVSTDDRGGRPMRLRCTLDLPANPRELDHVALAVDDVTAQWQLEQEMRAGQRMEAVGRLAGSVAHDFNNVLTVIRGYTELLRTQLDGQAGPLEDLDEIELAAAKAAKLTGQLLAFGRRQNMRMLPIDLNDALSDVRNMLGRLLGEDIDLQTRLCEDLHLVDADRLQLSQVLMNLVVNARDAMPNGGKLTIETANRELAGAEDTMLERYKLGAGRYVMLAVTDTGHGMDEATRRQIFEPFFTTKPPGKGTGLGLSTVYGIVRQSGGFIWVYSEVGHGTTVKVYLPKSKSDVVSPQAPTLAPPPVGGDETILLVEDDPQVRTATRRVLQEQGYRVLEAENGYEGLRMARRHHGQIDLVLSDMMMPKMGGLELARQLDSPGVCVLLMSGYPDGALQHQGLVDARVGYLEKPFSPARLLHRVRAALDGRARPVRLVDAS